ncbi:uncharacterized protein KGF55_003270 [Candida pseudojiufengensis]|uniref:uncharacterized protein n=1 Tax=Candida pseudojiufengensis TaxID=497109 RepID=UPI0022251D36|nr:uncharacterized protein KGF55_003270 [Candida pseudojiufengensis]KAI5962194.1 hypothetical protein KGF55_003270 [Candida pseudojiufengensis]
MVKIRYSVLFGFSSIQIIHDKIVHFITFGILTIEFYFIFDTQYKSLKLIRYLTFTICTIGGGIISEIIQHFVNQKRIFDPIDIVCNVLGSLLGLILSVLYQNYRKGIAKKERLRYHKLMNNNPESLEENAILNEDTNEVELGSDGRSTPSDYVNIQMKDV